MNSKFLKVRLCVMMFLQFFVWGAWYATAGNYMDAIGMTSLIYWAYTASPIGSIVSPFFLGMIADRFFAVQKVMGVMHLLSGIFVFCAPFVAEGGFVSPSLFLAMLLLHMLCYMPTLGLATAAAFHSLTDRDRHFPVIRMFGTIGWIAAGVLVSYFLEADRTGIPMHVAGIAGLLMGLYSFSLPHMPPPAAGQKASVRDIIGIDALHKLYSRPFVVFVIGLLLTSIPLATYFAYVPVFLTAAEVANPAFKMTFGQMSETLFLLSLPWFLLRFGVKWVFVIGMSAWVLRYALFAVAALDPITWIVMMGIILHGICYDFVYVAGQIYIDKKAPRTVRAQGQGLFVLVSYGIGQGLGALISGWIFNRIVSGDALSEWQTFWIVPVIFAGFVTFTFVFLFKDELPRDRQPEIAVVEESATPL